jgi:hypothetical protein
MSSGTFAIALGVGSALLAFWVQFRFPKLAPESLGWAIAHIVVAGALAQVTIGVFSSVALQPIGAMGLTFGLALPTLVYAFVAGMWMIRVAQGVTGRGTTQ